MGYDTCIAYVAATGTMPPSVPGLTSRTVAAQPLGERKWATPVGVLKRWLLPMPTMRGGMIRSLGAKIAELEPDVLVVTQLRAAPYADFAPHAALWFDQSDVWSAGLRAEISRRRGLPRYTAAAQLHGVRKAETKWMQRARALSAAGYADRTWLHDRTSRDVVWLPPPTLPRVIPRRDDGQRTAGFLGNFAYWPNRDAFTVIRDQWAPALRRLGWRTIVAGLESHRLDGRGEVEIIGPVNDLADYYCQIDFTLAPVRLGGGVKVKIIESLAFRRPVLATAYAVEGFPPDLAAAIPTFDVASPDFRRLVDHDFDPARMFSLATDYFSFDTWCTKVHDLVAAAQSGSGGRDS
jgi:hypothetical protein